MESTGPEEQYRHSLSEAPLTRGVIHNRRSALRSRKHRHRKQRRRKRLEELIRDHQMNGKRFGNRWRVNDAYDYWPNSGRVLDRRDTQHWIEGWVSGPDELAAVVQGFLQLQNVKVTRRRYPWSPPWKHGRDPHAGDFRSLVDSPARAAPKGEGGCNL